jgi:hypothetical protein
VPDGLAEELARYRTVTPDTIRAAALHWLDPARMVEVETIAAAPARLTAPGSAP